jgi:osomolarity two-component system, phosphorelay intermediate protein YPD1
MKSKDTDMMHNRDSRDLKKLSNLGHFLKGSSATLGLKKVTEGCEKIQHYGDHKDEHGDAISWSNDVLLRKIKDTLSVVKVDFKDAERRLRAFYHEE